MIMLVNLIGIINLHIAYHKKYKEINEFMDFFADTDLPPISEGEGKKFKMRTYLGFASRQVKMQILTVTMGYLLCTGKSFSEELILASTNPQYDKRLFIELRVQ